MTPDNPTDDPRWDRLIHLVSGQLPADEAAALRQWVEADPERRRVLAQLEEVWRATASPALEPGAWDAEAELRRIKARGEAAGRVIARVGPRMDRMYGRQSRLTVARVAAVLALLVGGGLLWRFHGAAPTAPTPEATAVAVAEYRTAPGERLSFHLPDGTAVILGPGGVLRRPSTYGRRDRTVYLDGEAYFVVTHDSTRPFAVHTDRAVARDLGTRFVVRAYQGEPTTDIVVAEGSVAVGRALAPAERAPGNPLSPDSLVLSPRDRATLTAAGELRVAREVDLERYLGWTEGRLVFDRTPLREVARRLELWYGIDVRLADSSLGGRRLTATIQYEAAPQAVDLVAASLRLSASRVRGAYVLGTVQR